MNVGPAKRKVLIVEDEPSIRNLLYVLLAGLGCEGDVAYTGQQALSMISHERFDAVLLDLRCSNLEADHLVSEIKELRPNLVGRVLVITGEVADPRVMEWVEKQCLPHVKSSRLMQELWTSLQRVLGLSNSPKTVSYNSSRHTPLTSKVSAVPDPARDRPQTRPGRRTGRPAPAKPFDNRGSAE